MCGINGKISLRKLIDPVAFNVMRDTLQHRGPDDKGTWISKDGKVALGNRRLAFLDLSPEGHQPMANSAGNIYLTFNGEIYNYLELKATLTGLGYHFKTSTDTEVLLYGYEEWGTGILKRLKGMFGFAIWDERKRTLLLARDRFGIKPLYYQLNNEGIVFGSELKAVVSDPECNPEVDWSSVCDYLVYRFVPSPKTIWKNISKLPPAHFLVWSEGEDPVIEEYWKLGNSKLELSEKEAVERFDTMLEESVRIHVRSDVQVGAFLSGGYDSSAIVYYLSRIRYPTNTFSIGFENWKGTEDHFAKTVANHFQYPNFSQVLDSGSLDLVADLVHFYDEPIADISIIPTYLVSQLAAQKNKGVLSGEGADELLVGYDWTKAIGLLNDRKLSDSEMIERYARAMAMGRFDRKEINNCLNPDLLDGNLPHPDWFYKKHFRNDLSPLKAFQYLDIKSFMGELVLTKVDRASMAHSLETRVPFLDHELVEFLFSLPQTVYYKPAVTKFLLYENLKKSLPSSILDRKKQGFVGPNHYYENFIWYASILYGGRLVKEKIIQPKALKKMMQERDNWRLWKLTVLELWLQKWT